MAELLVRVQNEHALPEGNNKMEDAPEQPAIRRILSMYPSDIDDDPDCLGSGSSEEDEYNHQIQELIMLDPKQKSIADQFQEALGAASTNAEGHMYAVPRHTGFGLFEKLQRIMQNEGSYFDVKIMSKSLEAKLTVCSCSYIENDERSTKMDNPLNVIKWKNLAIIFNPRICSDVELDVGTLVRIHHPCLATGVEMLSEPPLFPPFGIASESFSLAIGVEMLFGMLRALGYYRYRSVWEVDRFLQHLGLENHSAALRNVDMRALRVMTDEDLQIMGIPADAREKILEAFLEEG